MRAFVGCRLALPRRDRHGNLRWQTATVSAVTAVLEGLGRTPKYRETITKSSASWNGLEDRGDRLGDLRDDPGDAAEIVRSSASKSRGIPREGAALLHDITYCGECAHKMVSRYSGSQYVCNYLKIQRGAPECQNLRAAPIDAKVVAAFSEAVARWKVMRYPKRARPTCSPKKPDVTLRSRRLTGCAIKHPSPSASSIASIPTTGW